MRIFLFLFLSFNLLSDIPVTKNNLPTKKEIRKLADQASIYLHKSNYEKSFASSRLALKYAIAIKDDYLIAKCYNTIGSNYEQFSEFDKAIVYYEKGLDFATKSKNDTVKTYISNNLGNIYFFEKKQYEKGIKYYNKSLEFFEKNKDTSRIVFTKLNITWAYFDIGKFEQGKPYLDYINKHQNKYNESKALVILNMLNGMYYGYIGKNEKANSSFMNAIKIGRETNEKVDLSYSHQEYSKYLLKKRNFEKAYQNLDQYNKITKELNDSEQLKRAYAVGANLEIDEYKRKISKIKAEKQLQFLSLKKSKFIVLLFIFLLFITLLILYILYKSYIFKKKTNTILTLANEELIIAKEKAEEVSHLKTQFVSTITHELRTPLYGIVGLTNLLLDEHKELVNSPYLNSLKFSAKYLLSLINDVLQINKIEDNRIVLEHLSFNMADEINSIQNSLSFMAINHNNTINVIIDPNIPEFIIGDKLRLSQVMINLISNALKFTKDGEVNISVKLIEIVNSSYYIEFEIRDNGIGIAEKDQEKIFDNFVQVDRKEMDYQGTGLGLSIVKRLLDLFGSTISLESKIGEGTTFKFVISFELDTVESLKILNLIEVEMPASKVVNVLVVEDNLINQIVTRKIIEKHSFTCSIVNSGIDALEIVEKEKFDIILMDINMPIMNGFETTKKLRQKGINIPVIALTAFDKEEIVEEALSAGINDIIVKPFEPVKLFQLMNTLMLQNRNKILSN
ncbi:response regulator [Flavobacterium sp. K5-23]|uniref:response regulator n=1 Tax=Flavobacterium sp. K5-23 TaxID=2746225 RepID=UPI00200F6C90|nr:response regulator [Flavobacterium sp. K5-23]